MRKRGFSEQTFLATNPMPDVTDAEVLKRAELDMIEPKERSPFMMDWKYAPGPDSEYVSLAPGDSVIIRKSECAEFLTEFGEMGGVVIPTAASELEILQAKAQGLVSAVKKYAEQGKTRLVEIRKGKGLTKEDMDDYKYDHWAYYYNQARSEICAEHLKALREEIAELKELEEE
jgi:hypothetical protein